MYVCVYVCLNMYLTIASQERKKNEIVVLKSFRGDNMSRWRRKKKGGVEESMVYKM